MSKYEKSNFTKTQIFKSIQEHESGRVVWASDVKQLNELEEENAMLKRMYANLSLAHEALKDALAKSANV